MPFCTDIYYARNSKFQSLSKKYKILTYKYKQLEKNKQDTRLYKIQGGPNCIRETLTAYSADKN